MGHDTVEKPNLSFGRAGEPVRGTPYARYARLDELHSLQHPLSEAPAELSFIVTTQVMELLFGLLRHEWTLAQRRCARTTCRARCPRCAGAPTSRTY